MPSPDITTLLGDVNAGHEGALDRLMERVFADLERLAASALRREHGAAAGSVTLEPSDLVNETYLKLIRQRKTYDSRGHFFAIASKLMLRVLLDRHRRRRRDKRGGDRVRVTLSGLAGHRSETPTVDVVAISDAFDQLERLDPRTSEIAKLRLLWGLTVTEIAQTVDVSVSTVEREWSFGRRWLRARLDGRLGDAGARGDAG